MTDAFVIELRCDLTNPEPDRRSKDWHKRPTIPAGMRFIVRGDTITSSDHRYHWTGQRSELGKLVLANSVHVAPSPDYIREIQEVIGDGHEGDSLLGALMKMGRVHANDIKDAAEFLNRQYDAEEAARAASATTPSP